MKRLFAIYRNGWKRTRVPENVWDAYMEFCPTNSGTSPEEYLARASTDQLVSFMNEHFDGKCSDSYLQALREDLDADRGEKDLL